ncbi:unnamed protein product [Protopolystoma xenopodis]|uniref:Uncharacterized protein n=1 Tax=Protopolystoma xenopodis TaxID=117903 RepID=A0A3S5BU47_9PLAT|nr:unnamed protein product [Protopolystoma xenopodis]
MQSCTCFCLAPVSRADSPVSSFRGDDSDIFGLQERASELSTPETSLLSELRQADELPIQSPSPLVFSPSRSELAHLRLDETITLLSSSVKMADPLTPSVSLDDVTSDASHESDESTLSAASVAKSSGLVAEEQEHSAASASREADGDKADGTSLLATGASKSTPGAARGATAADQVGPPAEPSLGPVPVDMPAGRASLASRAESLLSQGRSVEEANGANGQEKIVFPSVRRRRESLVLNFAGQHETAAAAAAAATASALDQGGHRREAARGQGGEVVLRRKRFAERKPLVSLYDSEEPETESGYRRLSVVNLISAFQQEARPTPESSGLALRARNWRVEPPSVKSGELVQAIDRSLPQALIGYAPLTVPARVSASACLAWLSGPVRSRFPSSSFFALSLLFSSLYFTSLRLEPLIETSTKVRSCDQADLSTSGSVCERNLTEIPRKEAVHKRSTDEAAPRPGRKYARTRHSTLPLDFNEPFQPAKEAKEITMSIQERCRLEQSSLPPQGAICAHGLSSILCSTFPRGPHVFTLPSLPAAKLVEFSWPPEICTSALVIDRK